MDILTNLSHQMLKGKKEEDNLLLHMYNRKKTEKIKQG